MTLNPSDTEQAQSAADMGVDRNLAYLTYGLLFFSIFFAGAPALVAVALAYSRRDSVCALIASHHRFQILIFWVSFALALIASICFLTTLLSAIASVMKAVNYEGWDKLDHFSIDFTKVTISPTTISLGVATVVVMSVTAIWLVAASAFGTLRLASGRPIRQSGAIQ